MRGVANRELTPELALALGRALVRTLRAGGPGRPRIAVGRDSRLSGDLLEAALLAGILSEGADVIRLGIIPTPGVAFTARAGGMDAGVMISASHNPVGDNGVKFFNREGFKLSDEAEAAVEAHMGLPALDPPVGEGVGQILGGDAARLYVDFLRSMPVVPYRGRVLVDAAFGAAAALLPVALEGAAPGLWVMNGEPDGRRINVRSGSTHLAGLKEAVRQTGGGAIGLAYDGDADRMLAVDEGGEEVSGDHLVGMMAPWFREKGWLDEPKVALTVLSNLGLRESLERQGIGVVETPVGDRYLVEAMLKEGLSLGAEPSGHIVARPFNTTGDGLLTSLLLLGYLAEKGLPLREAKATFVPYPQIQESLAVSGDEKAVLVGRPEVQSCLGHWREVMDGRGRLVVRPSGTEPLVRVMVEAPDLAFCREVLEDVVRCLTLAREEV